MDPSANQYPADDSRFHEASARTRTTNRGAMTTESGSHPAAVTVTEAESNAAAATGVVWTCVAIAMLVGAVGPVLGELDQFSGGYFIGNDYPIQAILPTICLTTLLVVFAIVNWILHLGVSWRTFAFGLLLHLTTVAAGLGVMHLTFWSMVHGSVARAQAAVDAIHAFERARGYAPCGLKELVPDFMPRDPTLLYEDGPTLNYMLGRPLLHSAPGAWTIQQDPFEKIRLEYAPEKPGRVLASDERRMGDWIVSVSNPCWFFFGVD